MYSPGTNRVDRAGVALDSLEENIDTATSSGRLFRGTLGAIAEFERETINERVVGGMAEKATQGKRVGGPAPYGSVLQADDTRAIAEPQVWWCGVSSSM